jgi:hypothetical protein
MTRKTKQLLRDFAASFGLRIKYASGMSPKVSGFLDPSPASRTIVLNATKSKSDHAFTIAHEIGHFVLHCQRSHRIRLPWYLTRRWTHKRIAYSCKLLRRVFFRSFNFERQADMWAILTLMYIRATDDLEIILDEHPEKNGSFWLCVIAGAYAGAKLRLKGAFREVVHVFSVLLHSSSPTAMR